MVDVTQEDHGCAADVEEAIWNESEDIAVIIARHRTTALADKDAENAELRAKVEKLREALERAAQSFDAMAFALNSEQLFAAGKRAEGWAAQARAALAETQQ